MFTQSCLESACYLFLKFGTMQMVLRIKKLLRTGIRKILFSPKMRKMGQKWRFLHSLKNFGFRFSRKLSKMKNHIVIYISPQTPYLAKLWFSSFGRKYCWPIKLQDSLNVISQERKEGLT